MPQTVSYWEDHVVFMEGPFVCVVCAGWYRVEMQCDHSLKGCPILPTAELIRMLEASGRDAWSRDKAKVEESVRWLNGEVTDGRITKRDGFWEPAAT